jgi:hypothetical protein
MRCSDRTIGPEPVKLENRREIMETLRRIEEAAERNALPFVESAAQRILEAMEREEL